MTGAVTSEAELAAVAERLEQMAQDRSLEPEERDRCSELSRMLDPTTIGASLLWPSDAALISEAAGDVRMWHLAEAFSPNGTE